MPDLPFLKQITETPSVATACLPMMNLLARRFGPSFTRTSGQDSFALFTKTPDLGRLKAVLVSHVDEIGGCVFDEVKAGLWNTRVWGGLPAAFCGTPLQAWDYLDEVPTTVKVSGRAALIDNEERFAIEGDGIRPFRTVFTFAEESRCDGTHLSAKAIDPRATAYAVCEAVRQLDSPEVGALFVMAEECAMDVARKAVTLLDRNCPDLALVANADVPLVANLTNADLDVPAIRIHEGGRMVDPAFGIRMQQRMVDAGVACALSSARSGSQTILFAPLAPTLSIALPAEDIHTNRARASLLGIDRCVELLASVARTAL